MKKLATDGPPFSLDSSTAFPSGYLSSNSRLTKRPHGIAIGSRVRPVTLWYAAAEGLSQRRRLEAETSVISTAVAGGVVAVGFEGIAFGNRASDIVDEVLDLDGDDVVVVGVVD